MPRRRKESSDMSSDSSDCDTLEYNNNNTVTQNNNNVNNNNNNNNNNNHKNRHHSKKTFKLHKPVQRNAANARERSRMRVLSKAFSKLKTTLPWVPPDTKLSKLDTLRLASSYIGHLRQILDVEEEEEGHRNTYIHPLNLTWPFTFNGRALNGDTKSPDPIKCQGKSEGTMHC